MDPLNGSNNDEQKAPSHGTTTDISQEHVQTNHDQKPELHSATSSSSSSSESSEEGFFQIDSNQLANSVANSGNAPIIISDKSGTQAGVSAQLSSEPDVQTEGLGGTNNSGDIDLVGPTQTPPVQEMVRSDVPDPYRIPPSVFERTKSTTPMEWSVASNESLFSIHMGNNSFSKDHAILLEMSGDLPMPDFMKDHGQPYATPATNAEAMNDLLGASANQHSEKKAPLESPSTPQSHRSDGSATSINSFAFPILTEGRIGSMKAEPEKPRQPQGEEAERRESAKSEATPSPAQKSWFSCSSCFSCC